MLSPVRRAGLFAVCPPSGASSRCRTDFSDGRTNRAASRHLRIVEKIGVVPLCTRHRFYLRARNIRTSTTIRTNPQSQIQLLFQPCIPMLYPFTKPPQGAVGESGTLSGPSRPNVRNPSICLAAAAMAGFRCRCRLAQILRRTMIELLFAFGAAEVIRLPIVLGVSSGNGSVNVHAANGIFHNGGAAHWDLLGFVNFGRLRLSDLVATLSRAFVTRLDKFVSLASGSNRNHLTPEMNKSGRYCSGRRISRCSNAWTKSTCKQRFIVSSSAISGHCRSPRRN